MIGLKWIKSLKNFLWAGELCLNYIYKSQDLLIVLVDSLLSIMKWLKTDNLKYIYNNELEKSCFTHDAAYSVSKDLAKTNSDKVLKDRAYEIAMNSKYDGYQRGLAGTFYKFFDKKTDLKQL